MSPTTKYLWLTLQHKWYVFLAGLRTKAPLWRLIVHDWSKFLPSEAPHYGRQFFGPGDDPEGFATAWAYHQYRHPHHWERWILTTGHNRGGFSDGSPVPMPMWAVREMVADWMGASRAYEGRWPSRSVWKWRDSTLSSILNRVHPLTVTRILIVLREVNLDAALEDSNAH